MAGTLRVRGRGGIVIAVDADGVDGNVLRFEKPEGAQPWAGLTLVREALGSDLLGDGSEPITMRVFAAEASTFMVKLESESDLVSPRV